ncbi:hypothetical protein CEP53_003094 [Fusarium sp. AF-6]|nr:hypothetical protein CEP53_003094 [Fusarium sp. AF-6]
MDLKRIWSYDEAASGSPYPPKRQKTLRYNSNDSLLHNQYTIAWICALHIEMAAARAMLDETHRVLPQNANDKNTYTLGSIGPHNIVLACLPNGQYGTNNAASVLTNMLRSFPSICHGFIVGIGGGVPSRADMRLGDVVVGTRVMQYDLGKLIDGDIQRTADARIPSYPLRTAVSNLRSKHELEPSRVSTILQDVATRYPESPRPPYHPKIHHGGIASGNQVMKDSIARDSIARELDIICFEMEAAGLMDVLPCLPVRGICDYSDSHKAKEWQKYAAATAASYAKELIEILPANDGTFESLDIHNSRGFEQIDSRKTSIKKAHYKTCRWFLEHPQYLQWLDPQEHSHLGFLWIRGKPGAGKSTIMKFIYEQTKKKKSRERAVTASFFFHARGDDLEKSIPGMYRSLLLQLLEGYPDLQEALDDTDLVPRGQTGCPSLNILKDLFHNAVSNLGRRTFTCFIDALDECDEQQVMEMVHYFEELAESSASIGVQLRICFSSRHYPYIRIRHGIELTLEDQEGHSKDMDKYIRSSLRIKDAALAEDLRSQMIEKAAGVFLWLVLVVDILNKENSRGRLALRKRLAEAPSGLNELFNDILRRDTDNMEDLLLSILWILCAKRPLRPEEYYHALWSGLVQKGLVDSEVPNVEVADFSDCVKGHVITSSKGLAEITKTRCPTVQFIHESVTDFLVKDRGLQELWPDLGTYVNHGMVHACVRSIDPATKSGGSSGVKERFPFLEYASQYVLYHSNAAAQAIPQTEFLLQTSTPDWVTTINLFEKYEIRRYSPTASLIYILADKGFSELIRSWLQSYPEIGIPGERYQYPLFVALVNGHKDAFASLLGSTWTVCEGVEHVRGFGSKKDFVAHNDRNPLTWAAQEGLLTVVKLLVQSGADVDGVDLGGYTPLMRASEAGHEAIVSFLVKEEAAVQSLHAYQAMYLALYNGHSGTLKLLVEADLHWDDKPRALQKALRSASKMGNEAMVQFLIEKEVDIDARDLDGRTALSIACYKDNFQIVKLLIEANADLKSNARVLEEMLWNASAEGIEERVQFLIEKEVSIEAQDAGGRTALFHAFLNDHFPIVKRLIKANVYLKCDPGILQETLRAASARGKEETVKALIEQEVELDTQDSDGHTALSLASGNGHLPIVKLLIGKAQVEPSLRGKAPRPALVEASKYGNEPVVQFLIEKGAELNACDLEGCTALSRALSNHHPAIVKLLIESGAEHDADDPNGQNALCRASRHGHLEIVKILLEAGTKPDAYDLEGCTALSRALSNHHPAIVKLLIESGAKHDDDDPNGQNALCRASRHGHLEIVEALLEAEPQMNPDVKGSKLQSAFMRLLIDKGADIHARDNEGSTPLHLAVAQCHSLVVRILVCKGADANAINNRGETPTSLVEKKLLRADDSLALAIKGL